VRGVLSDMGGVRERVKEGDSHGLEIPSKYIKEFDVSELSEKGKKSIEGSIAPGSPPGDHCCNCGKCVFCILDCFLPRWSDEVPNFSLSHSPMFPSSSLHKTRRNRSVGCPNAVFLALTQSCAQENKNMPRHYHVISAELSEDTLTVSFVEKKDKTRTVSIRVRLQGNTKAEAAERVEDLLFRLPADAPAARTIHIVSLVEKHPGVKSFTFFFFTGSGL